MRNVLGQELTLEEHHKKINMRRRNLADQWQPTKKLWVYRTSFNVIKY